MSKPKGKSKKRNKFDSINSSKHASINDLVIGNPNKSRQQILEEQGLIQPQLQLDRDCFRKNSKEKKKLKFIKKKYKEALRKAGITDPKRLNISNPMHIIITR